MEVAPRVKRSDLAKAVQLAAAKWIADHGGPRHSQSEAARVAQERGCAITQPNLSWASRGEKIGPNMVDQVAELYETTGDGLVAMFLGSKVVALRDLPGWKAAKAEAKSRLGTAMQPWIWDEIDNVVLPGRVKQVDSNFVFNLATMLAAYGNASGIMARVR